jgi:general secretion pathway protein I
MTDAARRKGCDGGFSLLEVVVALAILALALGALYPAFSSAARRAHLVAERDRAVMLADSKLAEIDAAVLRPGIEAGTVDGRYRWRRRVEPYALPGAGADPTPLIPYQVTMEVRWGPEERARSIELTTVRLGSGG